jgi:hypothetical protein
MGATLDAAPRIIELSPRTSQNRGESRFSPADSRFVLRTSQSRGCGSKGPGASHPRHHLVNCSSNFFPVGFERKMSGVQHLDGCIRKVAAERGPSIAKRFLIGVSILRDDRRHSVGVDYRKPKSYRRSVVEDIERVIA